VKIIFRRLSLTSPKSLATNDFRFWVLEQLHREGEPLRWAITSIHRFPEKSWVVLEVEAVLINP